MHSNCNPVPIQPSFTNALCSSSIWSVTLLFQRFNLLSSQERKFYKLFMIYGLHNDQQFFTHISVFQQGVRYCTEGTTCSRLNFTLTLLAESTNVTPFILTLMSIFCLCWLAVFTAVFMRCKACWHMASPTRKQQHR